MPHNSPRLFSEQVVLTSDGSCVHVGFTSLKAGNLGLHVGNDPDATLSHRRELELELLRAESNRGFVYLNQVHGTDIFDADGPGARLSAYGTPTLILENAPIADAASSSQGTPLAIMVADCIPIVFVGEHQQSGSPIIGVAHAGRRGLLNGVIQKEIADLRAREAVNLRAWIGPAICGKCYEVPQEMLDESVGILPDVEAQTRWGTPALDLPAGAKAILSELLGSESVFNNLAACTFENPYLYSHRGHTQNGEPAGRIAGLVWVDPKRS